MTDDNKRLLQEMVSFLGGDPVASRTANALTLINVRTPQQLNETPLDEIRDLRQIGPACMERIVWCISLIDGSGASRDLVVDFERVARYLGGLKRSLLVTENRQHGVLTIDERAHVAAEVGRLADWYMESAMERAKEKQT